MKIFNKPILKNLLFYLPFIFSALIVYFSTDSAEDSRLPALMIFLPLCFFWIGDYSRQNSNEATELRREIEDLKKTIEELRESL
jgi:hypothetical protein